MSSASGTSGSVGLSHSAFVYGGTDDVVATVAPFVSAGIDERAAVFVAARQEHIDATRDAIGSDATTASWADTSQWYPHPATRLRAFHEFVSGSIRDGAPAVRLVGEPVWPAGPPAFVREWQRYESILNAVLGPFPVEFICLYDGRSLAPDLLESAARTHPSVTREGAATAGMYESPEAYVASMNPPLPAAPAGAARLEAVADLAAARAFLRERGAAAGLSPEATEDLVTAANEVITNAIVHGPAAPDVAVWVEDGRVVCQVEDRGGGITDALAGYRPPGDLDSGRGLWLARQLVDLLQIVPASPGTAVRLTMRPG